MVFVAGPKLAPYFKEGVAPAQALKEYRAKEGKAARLAAQPPGSVPNTTLQHWLWQVAKADKADAEIISMGIDATQQAVLVGAVEGAAIREPALTIVQGRNPNIKLVATGGQMFPSQPGTVVAVTPAFAKAHPDKVQGLVDALVKADKLLKENPDEAAPFVEASLGKGIVDLATIRKVPDLAGLALRRRSARHRRRDGQDAGLPGLDRHARQGGAARGPLRSELLREGGGEVIAG
jgi:NitT/TauT family transport system substrate-binding protein